MYFVEEETVPFDKDYLVEQIEAGGGRHLPKFDLDEVRTIQRNKTIARVVYRI